MRAADGTPHHAKSAGTYPLSRQPTKPCACLDAYFRRPVPALLSASGGMVFVPTTSSMADADPIPDAVSTLATAAAQPIVGTTTESAADELPAAADLANELLDLALRLDQPPGLYRLANLALEYQLTRPGYAKQRLAHNVEVLRKHPELLQTLQVHLRNELSRSKSAEQLYIHANTVDYRLKRIGAITGLDPADGQSIWRLYCALVVVAFDHPREVSGLDRRWGFEVRCGTSARWTVSQRPRGCPPARRAPRAPLRIRLPAIGRQRVPTSRLGMVNALPLPADSATFPYRTTFSANARALGGVLGRSSCYYPHQPPTNTVHTSSSPRESLLSPGDLGPSHVSCLLHCM